VVTPSRASNTRGAADGGQRRAVSYGMGSLWCRSPAQENKVVEPLLGQPRPADTSQAGHCLAMHWKIKMREGWAGGEVLTQGQ
jgi:hypothetical protein